MSPSAAVTEESIAVLTARAEAGDPRAMFDLGCLYDIPPKPGIALDLAMARAWYERAAELGFGWAQFALGNMYERAEGGTPRNDLAARRLYEAASGQGVAEAQMKYAAMLQEGRGGPADPAGAAHWYEVAAAQGHEQAATRLALMHLGGEAPSPDPAKAMELLEFAADKLDGLAHLVLGDMHMRGIDGRPHGGFALVHYCVACRLLPPGDNLGRAEAAKEALFERQPALRDTYEGHARDFLSQRQAPPAPLH